MDWPSGHTSGDVHRNFPMDKAEALPSRLYSNRPTPPNTGRRKRRILTCWLNSQVVGTVVECYPIRLGGQADGSRAVSGLVFACGRSDGGAARGGRGGAVGTAAGCGLAGDDRTWRGRRAALCALRQRRFCLSGQGARSAPLSVQGLREDIRRAHRHGAVGSAPQGALAVVRRVVGRRGDDTRVCHALRDCAEHGASLGATASWRRFGKRRTGLPGSSRPTRPSCLRAGRASGS